MLLVETHIYIYSIYVFIYKCVIAVISIIIITISIIIIIITIIMSLLPLLMIVLACRQSERASARCPKDYDLSSLYVYIHRIWLLIHITIGMIHACVCMYVYIYIYIDMT